MSVRRIVGFICLVLVSPALLASDFFVYPKKSTRHPSSSRKTRLALRLAGRTDLQPDPDGCVPICGPNPACSSRPQRRCLRPGARTLCLWSAIG